MVSITLKPELSFNALNMYLHWQGELMWPPPKISDPSPVKPAAKAVVEEKKEPDYFKNTLKDAFMYTAGLSSLLGEKCFYRIPKGAVSLLSNVSQQPWSEIYW